MREEELRVVVGTTEIVVDDVLVIEVVDVVRLVERVDGATDIVVEVVWVAVEAVRLWEFAELVEFIELVVGATEIVVDDVLVIEVVDVVRPVKRVATDELDDEAEGVTEIGDVAVSWSTRMAPQIYDKVDGVPATSCR